MIKRRIINPCHPPAKLIRVFTIILCYTLAFLVENVDGAEYISRKRTKIKGGLKRVGGRPQEEGFYRALFIVRNVYLIVLAPVIFLFLYSVLTDRATPHICRALWYKVKYKLLGHLAGKKVYAPYLQDGSSVKQRHLD